jgi:HK97 gp10 family phage protein
VSDGLDVTIHRRDALFAKLRQLAPQTDRELAKAVAKGASEVAEAAKQLAPVNTGELRNSIGWQMDNSRVNIVATVAADAYYARWVEFGTKGGALGSLPARPFMFPAYRLLKKRVQNRIGRAVSKAAKQVADRS